MQLIKNKKRKQRQYVTNKMQTLHKMKVLMLFIIAIIASQNLANGFSSVQRMQQIQRQKNHYLVVVKQQQQQHRSMVQLMAGLDDDNNQQVENNSVMQDNFDGKGLANYLGPYALAFVLSIGVTAAFVKFVLLDY